MAECSKGHDMTKGPLGLMKCEVCTQLALIEIKEKREKDITQVPLSLTIKSVKD